MSHFISSPTNPKVKDIAQLLTKQKARRSAKKFVVEGAREIQRALSLGWRGAELWTLEESSLEIDLTAFDQHFVTTGKVFDKLAYRQGTVTEVATFHMQDRPISTFAPSKGTTAVLVLEGIEKPGNLGAILRSAASAGISALFLADSPIDLYNPNVIRNSTGAAFELPVYSATSSEIQQALARHNFDVLITHMHSSAHSIFQTSYNLRTAFVFGEEARGLSSQWLNANFTNIIIPMRSAVVDSLNVSVAAALASFHWLSSQE